eukprot:3533388-Lingulodinium_polyedra.AAC.1
MELSFLHLLSLLESFQSRLNELDSLASPTAWRRLRVHCIPKVAVAHSLPLWRPLSLVPSLQNLYEYGLAALVAEQVPIVSASLGFRRGHQAAECIETLRMWLQKTWEYREPSFIIAIDIKKAFDNMGRAAFIRAMQLRG